MGALAMKTIFVLAIAGVLLLGVSEVARARRAEMVDLPAFVTGVVLVAMAVVMCVIELRNGPG